MSFSPRPNTFTLYRLFFTLVLFVGGIAGIGIFLLEPREWLFLHAGVGAEEHEAIMFACAVGGILSLIYGAMFLYLMTDRRSTHERDRRTANIQIDFMDRRSGAERRTVRAVDRTPHGHYFPDTSLTL